MGWLIVCWAQRFNLIVTTWVNIWTYQWFYKSWLSVKRYSVHIDNKETTTTTALFATEVCLRIATCLLSSLCNCKQNPPDMVNHSAATAWEFSQDLGNLIINLGFREFFKQSWEFWYIQEILWNTCNSKLTTTNIGCVHLLSHCLSGCHSAMLLQSRIDNLSWF